MSRMSANYIFGKQQKLSMIKSPFIFRFYSKWADKYVFSISNISHLMKFIVLLHIFAIL